MDEPKKHKLDFIRKALDEREVNHQLRSLTPLKPEMEGLVIERKGKKLINFCSNDYLGLATHPEVIKRAREYAEAYGAGSTSSRLVSGNYEIHEKLEAKLANTFGVEAALLFNTGFQANATVLSTLADRHSLILADKKVHSSLLQGAILSRADLKRYRHNDYDHLESFLKQAKKQNYNRIWIVCETVFSMDGDRARLDRLIDLSRKFDALLFSDDAHGVGVLGEKGLGLNYGKEGIDISLGTFGKAFGSFGAFVGCSKEIRDYLVNFCQGFIYTTALPPAVIGALDASLDLIPGMDKERKLLDQKIKKVQKGLYDLGFKTGTSDSQIIPVIIGDEQETLKLSVYLGEKGLFVSAIRPPTVKKDSSRIRITLSYKHTSSNIEKLLQALGDWNTKRN